MIALVHLSTHLAGKHLDDPCIDLLSPLPSSTYQLTKTVPQQGEGGGIVSSFPGYGNIIQEFLCILISSVFMDLFVFYGYSMEIELHR